MATFTLISSVTVGSGGAADIEFTSIPNTYTDLCLLFSARSANSTYGGYNFYMNTNSTRFQGIFLDGDGSSASSGTTSEFFLPLSTFTANTFGNSAIYIPNYLSSNTKSISVDSVSENNASSGNRFDTLYAYSLADSNAINALKLSMFGGDKFAQYTTAYLYGISNA